MLTGKQKRFLRSKAHHLDPIFQIGKSGINENMVKQVKEALERRELIKVSILQNNGEDKRVVAEELAQETDAELVQLIGLTIVLYKESEEHKEIVLPT
ncbi:ribosome assembly RNA-binding protein YhbY [Bacillaceae bacterium S4-13-58]